MKKIEKEVTKSNHLTGITLGGMTEECNACSQIHRVLSVCKRWHGSAKLTRDFDTAANAAF